MQENKKRIKTFFRSQKVIEKKGGRRNKRPLQFFNSYGILENNKTIVRKSISLFAKDWS